MGVEGARPPDSSTAVTRKGTTTMTRTRAQCDDGFRAVVRGKMIKRVVFSIDGRRIVTRSSSPFRGMASRIGGGVPMTIVS